jgi:hypothetical protein
MWQLNEKLHIDTLEIFFGSRFCLMKTAEKHSYCNIR